MPAPRGIPTRTSRLCGGLGFNCSVQGDYEKAGAPLTWWQETAVLSARIQGLP